MPAMTEPFVAMGYDTEHREMVAILTSHDADDALSRGVRLAAIYPAIVVVQKPNMEIVRHHGCTIRDDMTIEIPKVAECRS